MCIPALTPLRFIFPNVCWEFLYSYLPNSFLPDTLAFFLLYQPKLYLLSNSQLRYESHCEILQFKYFPSFVLHCTCFQNISHLFLHLVSKYVYHYDSIFKLIEGKKSQTAKHSVQKHFSNMHIHICIFQNQTNINSADFFIRICENTTSIKTQ